ncbi:MAG: class I SAM-dependent methyltransferase [Syntrophorhabdaceae bacterium]|nr:class I SAM-dependent methyltransferase [Syntrophorhabdaceae bacterium]
MHKFLNVIILILLPIFFCACDIKPQKKTQPDTPFASTPHKLVREMLKLADTGKDDVVYDLGSGDGRIVIAAARDFGAKGVGIELDKALYEESIKNAEREGVSKKVKFIQEDFFETDLKDATVVTLYLLPEINEQLLPKLLRELRPGSRIVSHMWGLGDWEPDKTLHAYSKTLYMWFVPASVYGDWKVNFKGKNNSRDGGFSIKQKYQKIEAVFLDGETKYRFSHANLYGNEIYLYGSYAYHGKISIISLEGTVNGDIIVGKGFIKDFDKPVAEEYTWVAGRINK